MSRSVKAAVLLCLCSIAVSVCSCDSDAFQRKVDAVVGTTAQTTETELTHSTVPTSVATITPTLSPTPFVVENIADPLEYSEEQYTILMEGIESLESDSPNTYLYMIKYLHDDRNNYDYWGVNVKNGNIYDLYVISDGVFTKVQFGGYDIRSSIEYYFTYDDLRRVPFLTTSVYLYEHGSFVDEIEDGTYYGEIIAISVDRDYGLFHIGTLVGTYNYPYPFTENDVFVILPIAEDYEVIDAMYSLSEVQIADWESQEGTGDPMFDSLYWYYRQNSAFSEPARYDDMGWYDLGSCCYVTPVTVSGGVVTSMHLSW